MFFPLASRIGLDADFRAELLATLADRVGVVGGVGDDRADLARFEELQQVFGLRGVAPLASGQREANQSTALACYGMDFGC